MPLEYRSKLSSTPWGVFEYDFSRDEERRLSDLAWRIERGVDYLDGGDALLVQAQGFVGRWDTGADTTLWLPDGLTTFPGPPEFQDLRLGYAHMGIVFDRNISPAPPHVAERVLSMSRRVKLSGLRDHGLSADPMPFRGDDDSSALILGVRDDGLLVRRVTREAPSQFLGAIVLQRGDAETELFRGSVDSILSASVSDDACLVVWFDNFTAGEESISVIDRCAASGEASRSMFALGDVVAHLANVTADWTFGGACRPTTAAERLLERP